MTHEHATNAAAPATALHYRRFTAADVSGAHALSMALRWPFRAEDWQFSADTSTAFVAEEDGVVIGTAMCWKYGADRAALGHVIVSSEHQGRGIGRALMQIVLDELGPRITFLHATPAGQPLYEKLGFAVCGSLDQFQGNVERPASQTLAEGERLRAATPADLDCLVALDTRASGLGRAALLAALLARGEGVVLERGGEIAGFAVLRRFGRGHVIGPVVAPRSPDDALAKALIAHWLRARDGEFVRIDVPSGTCLPDWLDAQGLKRVDTCSKMVRNAPAAAHGAPHDPDCGLYALVSQAMV
ncbi:GNAT family N-acetyltransferase [Burkholderia vietnamiensis]|uniref:GNAT family N-acetyltransferase n=1 Tax=Burkholderia vietnamiensis TaxID=60552 RepID=UPI001B96241C|nr:GNAT family N-acetyltransferase [Burkholderia vietnamiensis]MBR8151830.1 GNAT family N-acetyltransferase [Burkholderia vietnamiensis]MBR8231067.1 GNAT family N-acetyltransferase [Burkholderia vietnamiensis]